MSRWPIVLATASFLVGAASCGISLVAMGEIVWWTYHPDDRFGQDIALCSAYTGFGAAWMVAGRYYWKRRYRGALFANGLGLLILAIMFALLGV